MGCGNNEVSREHLSSDPVPVEQVMTDLIKAAHVAPRPPVRLPRAPESRRWGRDRVDGELQEVGQMYYYGAKGESLDAEVPASKIDYFIGPDEQPTVDPNRHIHVIHDEKDKTVILVVTDRTWSANRKDQHPIRMELPDDPPGNVVNQCISALVDVMNALPLGPREEQWP